MEMGIYKIQSLLLRVEQLALRFQDYSLNRSKFCDTT